MSSSSSGGGTQILCLLHHYASEAGDGGGTATVLDRASFSAQLPSVRALAASICEEIGRDLGELERRRRHRQQRQQPGIRKRSRATEVERVAAATPGGRDEDEAGANPFQHQRTRPEHMWTFKPRPRGVAENSAAGRDAPAPAAPSLESRTKAQGGSVASRERARAMLARALGREDAGGAGAAEAVAKAIERCLYEALVQEGAAGVEEAGSAPYDQRSFARRARSLYHNLNSVGNAVLRRRVLMGEVSPEALIAMTPAQLAAPEVAAERAEAEAVETRLRQIKEISAVPTTQYQCPRCGAFDAEFTVPRSQRENHKAETWGMKDRLTENQLNLKCLECGAAWQRVM